MRIDYGGAVNAEDSLAKIYINGEEFYGIGYQALMTVNTKTYVDEPQRSNDGSMGNIDDHDTFIVPRCKVNFKYFNIQDYMRLCRVLNSANQFKVSYFDKQFGEFRTYYMYAEPEEMAKIYNVGTSVIGLFDYEVSFVGTLNNLDEYNVVYKSQYWDGTKLVDLVEGGNEFSSTATYTKGQKVKWNNEYYEAIYYENTFKGIAPPSASHWKEKNYAVWNNVATYLEGDLVYYGVVVNGNTTIKYYEAIKDGFYGHIPTNKEYWKEVQILAYSSEKTYVKGNYCFVENSGVKTAYQAIYYNDKFSGETPDNTNYWTRVHPQVNVDKKVSWGKSIKVLSSSELSNFFVIPSGKKFKEWNTDEKGTGFKMIPNTNWTIFEDTTIYPIFEDLED